LLVITFIIGLPTAVPAYLVTRAVRFYADHLTQYSKQIFLGVLGTALVAGVLLGGTLGGWLNTLWVVLTALGFVAGIVVLFIVLWTVGTYIEGKRALTREKQKQAAAVYIAETGDLPPVKPSRTSRFFSGLGDFLVLLVQVVRVKKWKICPIVEIDK
jgi:MFS family permease